MSDYPKPVITGDVILHTKHNEHVLLIERAKDPFQGMPALPGGHFDINKDASIKHCAIRELQEETGFIAREGDYDFVGYFDKEGRDPRGRYIGFVWECEYKQENLKAGDDAKSYQWCSLEDVVKGEYISFGI